MAAVSQEDHWGGLGAVWRCGGATTGSYNSPKQQFLRYSNHLLQQYQQQQQQPSSGVALGGDSTGGSASGDYQLNGQEIITSSHSVYQVLELLGEQSSACLHDVSVPCM